MEAAFSAKRDTFSEKQLNRHASPSKEPGILEHKRLTLWQPSKFSIGDKKSIK